MLPNWFTLRGKAELTKCHDARKNATCATHLELEVWSKYGALKVWHTILCNKHYLAARSEVCYDPETSFDEWETLADWLEMDQHPEIRPRQFLQWQLSGDFAHQKIHHILNDIVRDLALEHFNVSVSLVSNHQQKMIQTFDINAHWYRKICKFIIAKPIPKSK